MIYDLSEIIGIRRCLDHPQGPLLPRDLEMWVRKTAFVLADKECALALVIPNTEQSCGGISVLPLVFSLIFAMGRMGELKWRLRGHNQGSKWPY